MLLTLIAFASLMLAFLFQDGAGATGASLPGVVPIIEGVGAATLTGYLVGFFKKGFPDAGPGKVVGVAIVAGLFASVIISMVNGGIQVSQAGIGTIFLQGIGAAALSAGVNSSNKPSVDSPKE